MIFGIAWIACVIALIAFFSQAEIKVQEPFGGFKVLIATAISLFINVFFNPFLWIVGSCFVRAGKNAPEPYKSKWRFYTGFIGYSFLIAFICVAAVQVVYNKRHLERRAKEKQINTQSKQAGSVVSPKTTLVLSGIMSSNPPAALVNGNVVQVGDSVGSFKVIEIQSNAVKFQDPAGTIVVKEMR